MQVWKTDYGRQKLEDIKVWLMKICQSPLFSSPFFQVFTSLSSQPMKSSARRVARPWLARLCDVTKPSDKHGENSYFPWGVILSTYFGSRDKRHNNVSVKTPPGIYWSMLVGERLTKTLNRAEFCGCSLASLTYVAYKIGTDSDKNNDDNN